ncbi:MAG: Calx-beta domain-containing protein, partial [Nocardioidaceae bacterium]
MPIARQGWLIAVVCFVSVVLALGLATPAAAQFLQGDIAGTWQIRGFSTDNGGNFAPGQWVRGTVTLSATGSVVLGSVTLSDGTIENFTPGTRLTLGANGLVSGSITSAGVARTVRATMTFDKGAIIGVADNAAHTIDTTFVLVRPPSSPAEQDDVTGEWVVFAINTPEDLLPGTTARGHFVLDSTGTVVSGSLLPSQFVGETLSGGPLTVAGDGLVTGSITGTPAPGMGAPATYDVHAVLDPAKNMLVGVSTRDEGNGQPRDRSFVVALRRTSTAVTENALRGVWRTYLHIVTEQLEGGAWLEGVLTIGAHGPNAVISPGALRNPDGSTLAITGGHWTIQPDDGDPSDQVSGPLFIRFPGVPFDFMVQVTGSLSPALDRMALTIYLPVSGPGGSLTISGLAIMVRQPSVVQFSAATYARSEKPGDSTLLVTVTRTGVGTVSVDYATTTGGTATAGVDYTATSGTLTFIGNATTEQFTITIQDDFEAEGQETLNLILRNPTGGAIIGARGTAVGLINDDEQSVEFTGSGVTVGEAVTGVTLTLRRSGPPTTAFTVPVTFAGGTAVVDQDYPASVAAGTTVSFAVGQVTRTGIIPLRNDTVIDGEKTLVFLLGPPTAPNVLLGHQTDFTITVTDNDTAGTVKFATAGSAVIEGATAKINVSRAGVSLAGGIDIAYAVTGGTATGGDYTLLGTGLLTFAAGQTTHTITVQTTTSDTHAEPPETVIITLTNPQGLATLPPATATHTLTITDNDVPGVLRFTVDEVRVNEADVGTTSVLTLTVTRGVGAMLASDVTVDYAVTGGTATNGAGGDYTLVDGTLSFGAGEPSKTILVEIHGDTAAEGLETIEVTLSNPTGRAALGTPFRTRIVIVDNEAAVFFPVQAVTVSEAATAVTITVARTGPLTTAFTVPITVVGGTAQAGVDYPAFPVGGIVVTFPAGVASKSVTISLLTDMFIDGPKTLTLQLGAPNVAGIATGTQNTLTITITDNDTPGTIGFTLPSSTVVEGKTVKIAVSRTGTNLAGDVTVNYAVVLGRFPPDATPGIDFTVSGIDFTVSGAGVLRFGPGATSATIDVAALADTLKEPVESFVLELSGPSHGGTVTPSKATHVVRITDFNQAGIIQWAVAAVPAKEDGGAIELRIKRTGINLAQDVVVSYALDANPGTAQPVDYDFTPGSVTFGAGETEKTVSFTPVNDMSVEP